MISSLRAQDPHARTPDTVSSNMTDVINFAARTNNTQIIEGGGLAAVKIKSR